MSLPVIFSSIALLAVDSTEAMPHLWFDVNKRAAAADDDKTKAAAAPDDPPKFSNKPTEADKKSSTTASAKPTSSKPTSAKPSSTKPSSAKPSSAKPSSDKPSVVPSSSSVSPTSVPPPLVVTPPNNSISSSATATPTSASANEQSGGISGGAIGGIVAAIIIIIGGLAAYFVLRKKKANKQRSMNTKPDPFTMGFGSDQGLHNQQQQQYQPQMQQNNLSVNTYQHQYGTNPQPSIAVTSPTSPASPYNNNFHDANNHIIADSMMTYQPQPQYQPQQQYQPQTVQQYQPDMMQENTSTTSMGGLAPTPAIAAVGGATAMTAVAPLLAPTQAGSVGVFYVGATYTPTLSDEIDIQTGDQVEVLVEYDDGWCQGINLSRGNAKGVFPKHCIDYGSADQQQPAVATAADANATTAATAGAPTSLQNGGEVDRVKRVSSMYIA